MQIEAVAQVAIREGLSEEQVAYEQWVDRQPLGAVVGWEEMGDEERGRWCLEVLGREYGQKRGERVVVESACGEGECSLDGGRGEEGYASVEFRDNEGGKEAVGDLGESRWIAVRTEHAVKEKLVSETQVVAEFEECPLSSAGMFKLLGKLLFPALDLGH